MTDNFEDELRRQVSGYMGMSWVNISEMSHAHNLKVKYVMCK